MLVFSGAFIISQGNSELVKRYQENNQVWESKQKKLCKVTLAEKYQILLL